ncbi:hypothetical protein C8R44DRAFT_893199 [Mycena epipterygia]|nr:hypothetical protein C8R44DRAFT_893199 [Mycena epipterygia]
MHQLSSTPNVLVFMGSRKLAAVEEALTKFVADIHPSSAVVPVQLDITDDGSVKAAHDFIPETLKEKDISGLDVLIKNAGTVGPGFKETYGANVFGTVTVTTARVVPTFVTLLLHLGIRKFRSDEDGADSHGDESPDAERRGDPDHHLAPWVHRHIHAEAALYIAYGTSKMAVKALTVHWALEEERTGSGIRVVAWSLVRPPTSSFGFAGFNATSMTHYNGMSPADGCKIIVKTALEKDGRMAVFFNKDADLEW